MKLSKKPSKKSIACYGFGSAISLAFLFCLPASGAVLATVGKRQFTEQDLKTALSQFNDGQKGNILKDPRNRRQVLSQLIEQELLFQEAERQKASENEQVRAAIEAFRRQQMVAFLLDKNLASRVTDSAAKKFYESNKLLFNTDEVRAQHILTQTEAEAREVLKKVSAPGADFQKIAETVSRDPSAKNNRGELGYFTRDQLSEEFTKAAFTASVGEIVGPVKTLYGYHVIRVMDKKVGRTQNFAEVELKVRGMLRQRLVAEYVTQLREQAQIKVDDSAVDRM